MAHGTAVEKIEEICARAVEATEVRVAVVEVLRRALGFDHHVWVLTDPVTTVGCAPYAEVPDALALPALVRARYLTPALRWTALGGTATRLSARPPDQVEPWSGAVRAHGITDVALVAHDDPHGMWAFLDLWRSGAAFTDEEVGVLTRTRPAVTRALRRIQGATFRQPVERDAPSGSGVLLVDDDLRVVGDTAPAMAWLARLLPRDDGLPPVPAVVLNVAAQLLATEAGADAHPTMSRVHVAGRGWITARAQRLGGDGRIAVTLAPVSAAERAEVYCRALGLSSREAQVLGLLGAGRDTRAIASELHLAPTTVQDHLKSVFAKTGTRSRGALVAHAYGGPDGAGRP